MMQELFDAVNFNTGKMLTLSTVASPLNVGAMAM